MAHFAKLDENNVVVSVEVVNNAVLGDLPFPDCEQVGIDFLVSLYGPSTWKQTSYSGSFRKNYAGIGHTFDPVRDAFICPQPFPSWTLDEATCHWNPPTPMPNDGNLYGWDEPTLSWVRLN